MGFVIVGMIGTVIGLIMVGIAMIPRKARKPVTIEHDLHLDEMFERPKVASWAVHACRIGTSACLCGTLTWGILAIGGSYPMLARAAFALAIAGALIGGGGFASLYFLARPRDL